VMTPHLSESDMAKMRKPHILYASSYDAIYFRDATVRLKQHARKTVLERENLEYTFPPPPKTPSGGIHGMSRLVNKILVSSYHTQSCTPSVFDGVIKISQDLTKEWDVVLYTMALGYDVEYLGLETEYLDGKEQEKWWETTVCTIAFIPSESTLVKKIITHYCQSLAKMKNENIDTLQAPFHSGLPLDHNPLSCSLLILTTLIAWACAIASIGKENPPFVLFIDLLY
jgi:hypothetical protein